MCCVPQDTSVSLSIKFRALVFLSHLLSSGSEADTTTVQQLLQNSEICSIATGIFQCCMAKGTAEYEGDPWDQSSITKLILLLSYQPDNAMKMVTELGLTEMLVHLLTFLRPTQTGVAMLAFEILLNLYGVKELQMHIGETGILMTVQVCV